MKDIFRDKPAGRARALSSQTSGRGMAVIAMFFVFLSFCSVAQQSNPFEVSQPGRQTQSTTDTIVARMAPRTVQKTIVTPAVVDTSRAVTGDNPFEVDHLPLPGKTPVIRPQEAIPGESGSHVLLLWVLLFSCALLAIAVNSQFKYFVSVTQSLWYINKLSLFHRNMGNKISASALLLYLVFFINAGVFVSVFPGLNVPLTGEWLGLLMLFFAALYLFRHLALFLFGRLFFVSRSTSLFSFTTMIFNFFTGIVLIPFNFLLTFGPDTMHNAVGIVSIACIGLLFVLRYFRGLVFISEYLPDRFFQFLLYLCVFEVSPLLILIKSIMEWSKPI